MAESTISIGRTSEGYLVRVAGRGTREESPHIKRLICPALDAEPLCLAIDLSECEYLDSTFLGFLLELYKRYGLATPNRVALVRPSAACLSLFAMSGLTPIFPVRDRSPELIGDCQPAPRELLDAKEIFGHLLECHRRLAEIDGPNQQAYRLVVEQLTREQANSLQ